MSTIFIIIFFIFILYVYNHFVLKTMHSKFMCRLLKNTRISRLALTFTVIGHVDMSI